MCTGGEGSLWVPHQLGVLRFIQEPVSETPSLRLGSLAPTRTVTSTTRNGSPPKVAAGPAPWGNQAGPPAEVCDRLVAAVRGGRIEGDTVRP